MGEIARHNEALDRFICLDIVLRMERWPDPYTVSRPMRLRRTILQGISWSGGEGELLGKTSKEISVASAAAHYNIVS